MYSYNRKDLFIFHKFDPLIVHSNKDIDKHADQWADLVWH